MALMQEAIPREDWERQDRGLPPISRKAPPKPEPAKPKIDDQISIKKINFHALLSARRENRKNKEGTTFIGYVVRLEVKEGARVKALGGWVPEADWMEFIRNHRGKINMEALQV